MCILVLNAGSSSLKFGCFQSSSAKGEVKCLLRGGIEPIGSGHATFSIEGQESESLPDGDITIHGAVEQVIQRVKSRFDVEAVGCRVVHGGAQFLQPTRVTADVLNEIRALAPLAPLHNPLAADVIETATRLLPQVPVVAVFDTAFHSTLPPVAATYALPFALCEQHGLRRYGFHGISHRYASQRLLECLKREAPGTRLITCHLGNGASVCAVRDGESIDTSMGLTPMEGLVMGTRSGDVDPGLIVYLMQSLKMAPDEIDHLLNHQSGLQGLSGQSGDIRELEQFTEQGDERAKLALEIFAYRVSKYIGAYGVALEGLDAVAFTGGIGQYATLTRKRICDRLAFVGLHLDTRANASAKGHEIACITTPQSPVQAWIIPADEEIQMAREVVAHLKDEKDENG